MPFSDSTADDITHELLNFLGCRFLEAARGAFDGVRETNDATLFVLRLRPAVSKTLLAYVRDVFLPNVHDFTAFPGIPLLLNGSFVKVSDQRCSMVLLNDIDDPLIQAVFERQIHTLFNMRDDDQSAHGGSKVIVWIFIADNVLGEIIGFYQLADIMKIRTRAAHRAVGPYLVGGHFRQVGDDIAMMPCTRGFQTEPEQQRMIAVRHLKP